MRAFQSLLALGLLVGVFSPSRAWPSPADGTLNFDLLYCASEPDGKQAEDREFIFERLSPEGLNRFSFTEKVTVRVAPGSEKVSYELVESADSPKDVAFQRQSILAVESYDRLLQFRDLTSPSRSFSLEILDRNGTDSSFRAVLVWKQIPTALECRIATAAKGTFTPAGPEAKPEKSPLSGLGIEVGVSRAQHHKNGVWFQKGFPYELDMTSGTISIFYRIGDHWRVGYTYLGRYSSDAMAITSDALYDTKRYECTLGPGKCPMGHFYGDGQVQGLDFSYKTATRKGVFLEGGLFVFWPTWTIHVDDYHSPEDGTVYNGLSYKHKSRIQFSPMASVGYQYKDAAVVLNCRYGIKALGDWVTAIYNGSACRITARYEFK